MEFLEHGVVEAQAVDAAGQVDFEMEPEFVGGVLEFAADPVLRGEDPVAVFDDEMGGQIRAGEGIDGGGRAFLEGNRFTGERSEGGFEIVGEHAERDFEFPGGAVVVGLRAGGVHRMGGGRRHEPSAGNQRQGEDQPEQG